ncbi:OLC1v1011284C1 [Oldenlandia corymbosa var. corymbosa]|uniref:OLC1v1011284C1 n=1 Tax=Oldenlandia corymbosa var. corymbosa TaxID=529605 RepID=A0AAV1DVQ9_OLDCO|nr:OLC1v1011284C1 [Oldenlandia corymbosa var. corymbosa]
MMTTMAQTDLVEVMNDDASSCDYPAIFNFGDSNSDTGGIAAAFYQPVAPFGETYFHRPAGRASDGRLIIDFIADYLGLPYLSPYLDSVGSNFQRGANFATGGATIRRLNESWFLRGLSPFPLEIQVAQFSQFKDRTTSFYNQGNVTSDGISRLPKPEDFSKALYTFDIGQNDISTSTQITSPDEVNATLADIINRFGTQIRGMYWKGARIFWIHNTGPIGCLPLITIKVRNPQPGILDEHGCINNLNNRAIIFNSMLKNLVVQLRASLPQAAITYVDVFSAKYGLISNATNLGFEDPGSICCGVHGNGVDVGCGNKATINGSEVFGASCRKPSTVISWDGVHYTEAANQWVATRIIKGAFSDPPIPVSRACRRQS